MNSLGLPAQLLDSADINDSVVEVTHELRHVLVQKLLISMNRVSWKDAISTTEMNTKVLFCNFNASTKVKIHNNALACFIITRRDLSVNTWNHFTLHCLIIRLPQAISCAHF